MNSEPTKAPAEPTDIFTRMRRVGLIAGFLLGAAGVSVGILGVLDAYDIPYGRSSLTLSVNTEARLRQLALPRARRWKQIGFLGDSTVIAYPRGHRVTEKLEALLHKRVSKQYRVISLGAPGTASYEYYTMAARIARARPDSIVIAFNLASLSENWHARWARSEMIGWVPGNRIPEALRLPVYYYGVTLDKLLKAWIMIHAHEVDAWYAYDREQVRTGRGIRQLRIWLQRGIRRDALPTKPGNRDPQNPKHLTARVLQGLYGPALHGIQPNQPVLRFLEKALETFKEAGIPTLLYTIPFDTQYLDQIGLYDAKGMNQTLQTLGRICHRTDTTFIDLHSLLPTKAFRDPGGHFTYGEKQIDGPHRIAWRIALALFPRQMAAKIRPKRGKH